MAEITGGELLLRCLKKEGVERIFGLPDFGYDPLLLHLADYGIRLVPPRHEAAAVHMAEGVYKTTGRIPVVLSGAGPGMANLVSGIICAKAEGVPVIAITAQRRTGVIYPARSGVYQGMDQTDIFRPVTKWTAVAHAWERIPEIVQKAFREATAGRPGPVHIDLPDSICSAVGDESKVRLLESHQYRAGPVEPSERQMREAAEILARAENPLVFAGTGVLNAGAWDELLQLIRILDCPVTTSMAGRSAVPNDHPNYLFGYGKGAFAARREADVVLVVGSRLGELDLPFDKYWGDLDSQKIIQIDIDPRNLGENRPIFRGIVGDAKSALGVLCEQLEKLGAGPSAKGKLKDYRIIDRQWREENMQPVKAHTGERIHPVRSIQIARKVFPQDSINVGDGGNTSLFNGVFSDFTVPRTALGLFEFGHLGVGIPYAIGAKLANPERDVYVITGDGAAGFNFMELETALREKVKITVIVHAEESWCMEEISQIFDFGDPSKVVGCRQSPVRWDKVAEGLGCYGEYVEKLDNLEGAVRRAKEHALPAVVCVKTDKQANLVPPGAEQFEEVYTGPKG
jgi:acetolactate synthase-1/2/3 large subunit